MDVALGSGAQARWPFRSLDGARQAGLIRGWLRVLKRLRAGELTSVKVGAAVADSHGNLRDIQPWGGLHVGAQLAADRDLYDLPAHLIVKVSEPLRGLYDRPFVDDLVSRAISALPVVGGYIDVPRPWAWAMARHRTNCSRTRDPISAVIRLFTVQGVVGV
jgi:hypothetical protein